MRKIFFAFVFIMILALAQMPAGYSQCAMCKAVVKSNRNAGQASVSQNLNMAVLYLMSVPYLLGGLGVFIYWRNRRKSETFLQD